MLLLLSSCAKPVQRGSYDRETGSWYSTATTNPESPGTRKIQDVFPKKRDSSRTNPKKTAEYIPNSDLRKLADAWIGTPYAFGKSDQGVGTDCSGLVTQLIKNWKNIDLPRHSQSMFLQGKPIAMGALEVGDVVFFGPPSYIDHTGIFMGNGMFIHSSTSVGVEYRALDDPYWVKRIKGARRYGN